jgi:hypothetical protein
LRDKQVQALVVVLNSAVEQETEKMYEVKSIPLDDICVYIKQGERM